MQFVRMVQFTRLIKINGRLREFNFRKLKNEGQDLFSVNVVNDRGDRILFHMSKTEGQWRILAEKLPDWISQGENALNDAIEDELQSWD
jgi:hypothetical protein